MVVKLSNDSAGYFVDLLNGKTRTDILNFYLEAYRKTGRYNADQLNEIANEQEEDVEAAELLFNKMKKIDRQEFAIEPWGYDQQNYDNFEIVGTIGGSLVAIVAGSIVTISKKKLNNKEYTKLDSSRWTLWEDPYTKKFISDQAAENIYFGH